MKIKQNIKLARGRAFFLEHMTQENVDKVFEFAKEQIQQKDKEVFSEEVILTKQNGKEVAVIENIVIHNENSILFDVYDNKTKNKDRFNGVLEINMTAKTADVIAGKFKELVKSL